jgi:hypothetical protein
MNQVQRVNYQIELQTIYELARVIMSPRRKFFDLRQEIQSENSLW